MIITRRSLALAAAGATLFPAVARAQEQNALQVLEDVAAVSMFLQAVKNHGLEGEFTAPGRFGFWIPVNHGIESLPSGLYRRLETDKEYARETILNHITAEAPTLGWGGNRLGETIQVRSKAGYTHSISLGTSLPRISGQPIIRANIRVSNGLMYGIDGILRV
jgi:uncharacterized surface protein with fasciclin (FAS1) repeats